MRQFGRRPNKKPDSPLENVAFDGGAALRGVGKASTATLHWLTTDKIGRRVGLGLCLLAVGTTMLLHTRKNLNTATAPHGGTRTGVYRTGRAGRVPLEPRSLGDKPTQELKTILDEIGADRASFKFDSYDPERLRSKLTPEERIQRTKHYTNPDVTILEGLCGLKYYVCNKQDEREKDPQAIREKLTKIPEFAYLQDSQFDEKTRGMNIVGSYAIKDKALIPIPSKDNSLTDKELLYHANIAIDEMLQHPRYKAGVKHILDEIGRDDLLILCVDIAKKECGPFPIGFYQWFRSEHIHGQTIYSYSMYHILNDGHGKKALNYLDLAVSQTYNPVNATKWFLGFLLEKSRATGGDYSRLDDIIPLYEGWERRFAERYNGTDYAKNHYVEDITNFRRSITEDIDGKRMVNRTAPQPLTNFESPLEPKIQRLVQHYHDLDGESKISLRPDEHSAWYVKVIEGPGIPKEGKVLVSINGEQQIPSASMNKVQNAIAYYSLVQEGKIVSNPRNEKDIHDSLAISDNKATRRIQKIIGEALGAHSPGQYGAVCESYLKGKYPGMFDKTVMEYIPEDGRAYVLSTTVHEYTGILEALDKRQFPGSEKIIAAMTHPSTHNRLIKGTETVRASIDTGFTKTATHAGVIGDGGVMHFTDEHGQKYTYAIVVVFHRDIKPEYQNRASTTNFQKRANVVIRGGADLVFENISPDEQ